MTQTSRPSSHVLGQIESALLRRYQLQVQVDQLLAGIAILNEKAETLALEEFGQDLAPAAIMMAERSLPSIVALVAQKEQQAASDGGNIPSSPQAISTADEPGPVLVEPSYLQPPAPVATPIAENDAVVTSDDFLGVAVPAGRTDEAYDILEEAKTSFRQGQKNNPYATNRGKNSWRNALFAKALENFYESGLADGDEQVPVTTETFLAEMPVFDDYETATENSVSEVDSIDDILVVETVVIDAETLAASSDEDLSDAPTDNLSEALASDVDANDEDYHEPDILEHSEDVDDAVASDAFDSHLPDFDEVPDDADDADSAVELRPESVALVDVVDSETRQETSPNQTFTLDETFFSDDVAHSDPLTIENEAAQVETIVSEPAVVPAAVPSVAPVADDMTGAPMRIPPSAAARAVSVTSLPPAMRPGAMVRPQHQPASTVVEQAPAAAPAPQSRPVMARPATPVSVPRPAAVVPAPTVTKSVETATPAPEPASSQVAARPTPTSAPRPGFARPQPSAPVPVVNRQPGYGASVTKAPEGLEKALEEQRLAEEAKANGTASAPASRPIAPPRPGAPIRPSFAPSIRR